MIQFGTAKFEFEIRRNDRYRHELGVRMRYRGTASPAVIVKNLDGVHALLAHERQISVMVRIHHLRYLPRFEFRDGFLRVTSDDDFMIPDPGHREIRPLGKVARRSPTVERRKLVRNDRQTPIPVRLRIEQHRFLLAARLKVKKGVLYGRIVFRRDVDTKSSGRFARPTAMTTQSPVTISCRNSDSDGTAIFFVCSISIFTRFFYLFFTSYHIILSPIVFALLSAYTFRTRA
jgi:hypothetical protein